MARRTVEERRADREGDLRRRAEIAAFSLVIRTVFEHSIGAIGSTDGSSNAGVLYQLRVIDRLRDQMPDTTTIGQLSAAFLEYRLSKIGGTSDSSEGVAE